MNVAAGAGAATTAVAGTWLFNYNRANFQYDQGMRFGRFTAARGFANAQVGQYREDIVGIVGVTQAKMDAWTTVCALFLCVCAALSDAGRIGMHGCAPPGWLCALYSGNIFQSVMYCGLALWLSMHGSLRAQSASVSLRTRKVRLPVPSMEELDRARNFGSAYEKQEWNDIFRVPFMRHPQWAPDSIPASETPQDDEKDKSGKKGAKAAPPPASADHYGSTNRSTVPSWIRDEQVMDKGDGTGMAHNASADDVLGEHEDHEQPEHFRLLQAAQEDWYNYDIYARVCMLYGTCHFLYAVTYYSIGTTTAELRGFWISWSLPMLFLSAQALILRMDILNHERAKVLHNVEWLGHTAPYWAVLGTTLEYRAVYSPAAITVTWVFVVLAFFSHFMFALRFLDLAWPDSQQAEMDDTPGKEWWPRHWAVPSAFARAMWLLAPPQKLPQDQSCLLHEMVDLAHIGGGVKSRRGKSGKKGRGKLTLSDIFGKDKAVESRFQSLSSAMTSVDQKETFDFLREKWAPIHRNVLEMRSGAATLVGANGNGNGNGHGMDLKAGKDVDRGLVELQRLVEDLEDDLNLFHAAVNVKDPEITAAGHYKDLDMAAVFQENRGRRPADLPWQLTRVAIITGATCWFYMMVVSVCECVLGPAADVMKPPGEPPWIRDTKRRWYQEGWVHVSTDTTYPSNYKLWSSAVAHYPEGEEQGDGHDHRRLEGVDVNHTINAAAAYSALLDALPKLGQLAASADSQLLAAPPLVAQPQPDEEAAAEPSFMAPSLRAHSVQWPAFFEPRLVATCPAGKSVVALAPRGFGALAELTGDGGQASPFSLSGVSELGPLAGAGWTHRGLELVTKQGTTALCPGRRPDGGAWGCEPTSARALPVPAGAEALAAAVTELGARRVAALLLSTLPDAVAILEDTADGWVPMGQVRLRSSGRHGLSFVGEELLAVARGGEVLRKNVMQGSLTTHPAPAGSHGIEYHSASALPNGNLVRLALRRSKGEAGASWRPELLSSA